MKIAIHLIELEAGCTNDVYANEFNTADIATFLVAPWSDRDTPCVIIPDGMHVVGFRFFSLENSISVYISKGKLVPCEQWHDWQGCGSAPITSPTPSRRTGGDSRYRRPPGPHERWRATSNPRNHGMEGVSGLRAERTRTATMIHHPYIKIFFLGAFAGSYLQFLIHEVSEFFKWSTTISRAFFGLFIFFLSGLGLFRPRLLYENGSQGMTPDQAFHWAELYDAIGAAVCEIAVTFFILIGIGACFYRWRIYRRYFNRAFRKRFATSRKVGSWKLTLINATDRDVITWNENATTGLCFCQAMKSHNLNYCSRCTHGERI